MSGQHFSRMRRLCQPQEFRAATAGQVRLTRRYLALHAAIFFVSSTSVKDSLSFAEEPQLPRLAKLRYGITVGKRNARHSTDRSLIKRVLREAARSCAAQLEALLSNASSSGVTRVDVVLRLKAPIKLQGMSTRCAAKLALRGEADYLLTALSKQLSTHLAVHSSPEVIVQEVRDESS